MRPLADPFRPKFHQNTRQITGRSFRRPGNPIDVHLLCHSFASHLHIKIIHFFLKGAEWMKKMATFFWILHQITQNCPKFKWTKSDSFRYVRRDEEEMAGFCPNSVSATAEQNSLSRFSSLQPQRQRNGGQRQTNLHFIQIYF